MFENCLNGINKKTKAKMGEAFLLQGANAPFILNTI
jgi:hypothetical protein